MGQAETGLPVRFHHILHWSHNTPATNPTMAPTAQRLMATLSISAATGVTSRADAERASKMSRFTDSSPAGAPGPCPTPQRFGPLHTLRWTIRILPLEPRTAPRIRRS